MFAKSNKIFVEKTMLVLKGIVLFIATYLFTKLMNGLISNNIVLILIESVFVLALAIGLYVWDIKYLKTIDNNQ